jgi:hypothetical protein
MLILAILVPHIRPHAPTPLGIQILSLLFGLALVAMFIVGGLVLTFVLVSFVWKFLPDKMTRGKKPVEVLRAVTSAEVKRVALDYLMAEKIRQRRAIEQHIRASVLGPPPFTGEKISNKPEWDLNALKKAAISMRPVRAAERTDLWTLVKTVAGAHAPQYLCHKVSQKGVGLRAAFAPIKSHALTMDLESAKRWSAQLGPDIFIVPANAAARQVARAQMTQAVNRTEEEQHA